MAGLDDPRLAGLEKALGRVALVQMDNRYCTNRRDWIASIPPLRASWFWWKAAHINSLWAAAHQYDHIVYCSPGCSYCSNNGSLVMRRPSWCKIRVVSEVMQAGEHSTVVFMDSDAYVSEPRLTLSALLVRYTWPRDWPIGDAGGREGSSLPCLFFACNDPFSLGWPQRPRPSSALPPTVERQLVRSGPPNSGIWLARRSPSTLSALQAWWHAREDEADQRWQPPPRSWAWHRQWREQGALWDLMLSNTSGFMRHARVLGAPPHHGRRGATSDSDGTQQPRHCLGGMAKPTASGGQAERRGSEGSDSYARSPVRHLVHHHFKQASTRAAEMQPDLEAAVTAASEHIQLAPANAEPSRHSSCRTHLLRLHPTDPGSHGQCASRSQGGARHLAPQDPRGRRQSSTNVAPSSAPSLFSRSTCVDELMVQVPPCKRALRADRCAPE